MTRPQIVIENPILNAPFGAPARHFRFDDEGITDEIVDGRRPSSYFITKRKLIVINDEAHHCYRRRVGADEDDDAQRLAGEDKREAAKRDEEARVWVTGLQAVAAKTGVRVINHYGDEVLQVYDVAAG